MDQAFSQTANTASMRSGYALLSQRCGTSALQFPKMPIGMRTGYCAGLVASKEDGLLAPRSIVQISRSDLFVVADMGGWAPGQGRLLLLDPGAAEGNRIKVLIAKLDLPHGLAIGIDNRVYASTVDKVFRFDPLAQNPAATIEVIVQDLPGLQPVLSDGSKVAHNFHPLKLFVFDRNGNIYINIGAPSDNCGGKGPETKPCAATEGNTPLAAVWMFRVPRNGIFPALKPGDANPPMEVFARGLRNSMALAAHPRFPDEGFHLLQAENARDLKDPNAPNDELNVLEKGRHFGWPYCYDLSTESDEYKAFMHKSATVRGFCTSTEYQRPYSLMPPHAAPLGMLYYPDYPAGRLSELKGKLIVSLHGYRPTGSRVIFYEVDAKGLPLISLPPVTYNVSCATPPAQPFRTERKRQVPAAPFSELIAHWHKVEGVRPRGAPVGMTVAADGAIWLVEDKNQTILRIDVDPSGEPGAQPCNARTAAGIKQIVEATTKDSENVARLSAIRTGIIERHCAGCHSDFGLQSKMNARQKNEALLAFLLSQDGWINPGRPESGTLHRRLWGKGSEKIMPADGRELLAHNPDYRKLIETLDLLVEKLPGGQKPAARLRN